MLDANALIARCDEEDASHRRAVELIDHHEWDEFLTSAVTLAEVLVRPARDRWADACRDYIDDMHVLIVPIEDEDAPGIAALSATHRLKSADAAVLHSAIMTSDALVTFDRRLARVAEAIGFPVIEDVPAEEPEWAFAGI